MDRQRPLIASAGLLIKDKLVHPVMDATPPLLAAIGTLLLPSLTLLFAVVLLSFSYRFIKTLDLSSQARYRLTTFHAFATEGLQILIAVCAVMAAAAMPETVYESWGERPVSKLVVIEIILASLHVLAVYAVDVIEARVLIGSWRHPYGGRCFVVTLTWLIGPWKEDRSNAARRRIPLLSRKKQEFRGLHEALLSMPRWLSNREMVEGLRRADWLDLADPPLPTYLRQRRHHRQSAESDIECIATDRSISKVKTKLDMANMKKEAILSRDGWTSEEEVIEGVASMRWLDLAGAALPWYMHALQDQHLFRKTVNAGTIDRGASESASDRDITPATTSLRLDRNAGDEATSPSGGIAMLEEKIAALPMTPERRVHFEDNATFAPRRTIFPDDSWKLAKEAGKMQW